jgi:4-amino-4-deoxy-L-arabinose transferase-like glycosyltransferase
MRGGRRYACARRAEVYAAASPAGGAPSPPASSPSHAAWASTPARRTPPPWHQGQVTSCGLPPRFEITCPVPRQGIHASASRFAIGGEISVTGTETSAGREQPTARNGARPALRGVWRGGWVAVALITLGAAALRLAHLGQVVSDPFYDGAVRSMTLSWHNFFFGAVEPSGAVSIDKPPVDLWLQVASVELFGWSSTALKLPQALAGTAAVPLLFAALRRLFGVRAGLAAALALAVLPIEVITARSDTMDALMMALTVLALLLTVRATDSGRTGWLLGAAVALGLAFNVKLLESLPALPALALLAWLGMPGRRRRRAVQLALAGVVYVAVALSWLTATLLFPAPDRPYAYGSTNGSAWNSAFVFNGLDRLENKAVEGPQPGFIPGHRYLERTQAERDAIPIVPASATRLLARIGPLSGERLGLEVLAGLLLGGALLLALLWRPRAAREAQLPASGLDPPTATTDPQAQRRRLALAAGLMLWLAIGIVLFSHMARLHPRYTEAFTPAVAATLGIGVSWATERRTPWRLAALTGTLLAVTVYAESLLFGATALWWIVAAGAAGALALAWTPRLGGVDRAATASSAPTPDAPTPTLAHAPAPAPAGLRPTAVLVLTLVCLLAIPLWSSLRGVRENVSDTTRLGALHSGELQPLSAYLRAHQGSAYYEAAFDSGTKMGELVVRDARPILVLSTLEGRVFTSVARLRALIAAGKVRYAFLDSLCGPRSPPTDADCTAPARWVQAHATDVSQQAHMPRRGMLWLLPEAGPRPGRAAARAHKVTSSGARRHV